MQFKLYLKAFNIALKIGWCLRGRCVCERGFLGDACGEYDPHRAAPVVPEEDAKAVRTARQYLGLA